MDIAQTLENLTLNKGKLDYATILKLQETLADACRIHDETHADEMAAVLEKMRLRGSEGAADAAAPQPAYDFTSPGRGAASDAQWSPTPLGADGERSVERAMFGSAFSPAKRVSPETPVFVFGTPVAARLDARPLLMIAATTDGSPASASATGAPDVAQRARASRAASTTAPLFSLARAAAFCSASKVESCSQASRRSCHLAAVMEGSMALQRPGAVGAGGAGAGAGGAGAGGCAPNRPRRESRGERAFQG